MAPPLISAVLFGTRTGPGAFLTAALEMQTTQPAGLSHHAVSFSLALPPITIEPQIYSNRKEQKAKGTAFSGVVLKFGNNYVTEC